MPTTPVVGVFTRPVGGGLENDVRGNDNALRAAVVALQAVVGPQEAAIADPTGGATVDAEARAAVVSILDALRNHGLIAT